MNDDYVENLLSKYGRNKPVRQGVDHSTREDACYVAADMIESLQAQLTAMRISNDGLCISHDTISRQLAEIRRREEAAEDLINRLEKDINTISRATKYIKPETGVWHTLGIMLQAIENWRGQGRGDTSQCEPTAQ